MVRTGGLAVDDVGGERAIVVFSVVRRTAAAGLVVSNDLLGRELQMFLTRPHVAETPYTPTPTAIIIL